MILYMSILDWCCCSTSRSATSARQTSSCCALKSSTVASSRRAVSTKSSMLYIAGAYLLRISCACCLASRSRASSRSPALSKIRRTEQARTAMTAQSAAWAQMSTTKVTVPARVEMVLSRSTNLVSSSASARRTAVGASRADSMNACAYSSKVAFCRNDGSASKVASCKATSASYLCSTRRNEARASLSLRERRRCRRKPLANSAHVSRSPSSAASAYSYHTSAPLKPAVYAARLNLAESSQSSFSNCTDFFTTTKADSIVSMAPAVWHTEITRSPTNPTTAAHRQPRSVTRHLVARDTPRRGGVSIAASGSSTFPGLVDSVVDPWSTTISTSDSPEAVARSTRSL
mmetsp:Transcript_1478/g.4422  ORF Transcript_1478/g.4422 Transcript_1478/m.4422 type:complete len:346 (+) Transcript_1478:1542-2579(+)